MTITEGISSRRSGYRLVEPGYEQGVVRRRGQIPDDRSVERGLDLISQLTGLYIFTHYDPLPGRNNPICYAVRVLEPSGSIRIALYDLPIPPC